MAVISRGATLLFRAGAFDGLYDLEPGTTKNTGTPTNLAVRRRVCLFHQRTGTVVRELWSDAVTGAYQFTKVASGIYFVVAFDYSGLYNGETTTDIVVPTP